MNREGEESTLYSAALRGLRSMTLGDGKSVQKKAETQQHRASDSELLGQLPKASEFSPAEVVPRFSGLLAGEEGLQDESRSLQWLVSSVQDKEADKSMSKTKEGEACVFCGEGFKAWASAVLCRQGKNRMHPRCWSSRTQGARAII
eukprot:2572718-Rhodomonas_salina.1